MTVKGFAARYQGYCAGVVYKATDYPENSASGKQVVEGVEPTGGRNMLDRRKYSERKDTTSSAIT